MQQNTLQLVNRNRASSDAIAAAIAEMEKDSKHAGSVEIGGHFFSLVTVTLGVWTSSSILLLCTFAERTTLRNGLSMGVASGSGWKLWVWLLGVVVRRYIDFLILLIPTPLVSVIFCSSIPTFCSFLNNNI